MIESIMYFGMGFLVAVLSVLVVVPLIHGRAVRLTVQPWRSSSFAIASIAARSLAVRGRPQRETRRPTVRAIGC